MLLLIAIITLLLSSGATRRQEKHYTLPNAAFFFANNDDYYEAFRSIAQMMCAQDNTADDSPEAWAAAATQCEDSGRDEDGYPVGDDGKWHKFVYQAIDAIARMCQGNSSKLCGDFR